MDEGGNSPVTPAGNVRLKDVATATGYSVNTVSLALRGSVRLPRETRERIRKVARELDYLPNVLARALAGSQCYAVGLVLTDILNPVLTGVAQEISSALHVSGYSTLFATSNNEIEREIEVIRAFRSRQADGILVFPVHHQEIGHLVEMRQNQFAIVSLAPVSDPSMDCVCLRERKGARMAVEHLVCQGHRDIAILDAASPLGNFEKRDGYLEALQFVGLPVRPDLQILVRGHQIADGRAAMARLRKGAVQPTAVFATSDPIALGALQWCRENSVRVPEDVSVMGFDDTGYSRISDPPLSTVRFPVQGIARASVEHLQRLIARCGELPAPVRIQLEPELIVRASTAAAGAG